MGRPSKYTLSFVVELWRTQRWTVLRALAERTLIFRDEAAVP